ncbi:MAG: hypothetical protein ACFFB6_10220 [Promethearchaeota archaeon]
MDVKRVVKYLFALPYLGGILVIVSFLTPVVSDFYPAWFGDYSDSYSYWMWGLLGTVKWYLAAYWHWNTYYSFIPYIFTLILGLICSILIIFFALKTILRANRFGRNQQNLDMTFAKYSAVIFSITIIWMIAVEIFYSINGFMRYEPIFSFWSHFNVQFGVYGIFLGGSLIIIGFLLTKYLLKRYDYLFDEEE